MEASRDLVFVMMRIVLLAIIVCHAPCLPARADEAVAQELADCQDEERPAEQRLQICTVLIGMTGIDDGLKAEALLNRGMARQDTDDLYGAISDYTDAIALNPEYPALYVQRADAYADAGNLGLAIDDMTRAIALEPDDADSFATRGDLYAETGELALAKADYRRALVLEDDHEQARQGLKRLEP
jgi:tetratricopeptide (TPR) repeat protein